MQDETSKWHFLKLDSSRIVAMLLIFVFFGHYMFLPGIMAAALFFGVGVDVNPELPGEYQYPIFYSLLLINLAAIYFLVCAAISLWENRKTFLQEAREHSRLIFAVMAISFFVFFYRAVYIPMQVQDALSIRVDTPDEININSDYRTFSEFGAKVDGLLLQEFVVKNDSDHEARYDLPANIEVCLYDIDSGVIASCREDLIYDDGRPLYRDSGSLNTAIVKPNTETKIYMRVDRDISSMVETGQRQYAAEFDEFLIFDDPQGDLSCENLGKEEVGLADEIIRIKR